jgi:hypothetical protein
VQFISHKYGSDYKSMVATTKAGNLSSLTCFIKEGSSHPALSESVPIGKSVNIMIRVPVEERSFVDPQDGIKNW